MSAAYDTGQTPTILSAENHATTPWAAGNFTPAAGSDRTAYVIVGMGDDAGSGLATGVTLGGQAMTQVGSNVTDSNWVSVSVWKLNEAGIAAMSGNAVSVAKGGANPTFTQGICVCFTVTGTSDTESSVQTGTGAGNTLQPGAGVSSTADGLVIAAVMSDDEDGITVSAPGADDSGQLKSDPVTQGGNDTICAAQYRSGTGGSVTPAWTATGSQGYAVIAFNVEASGGGGGGAPNLPRMPVGEASLRTFNMSRVRR